MANVAKLKKKAVEFEQKKQFDKALTVYVQILGALDKHVDEADVALYNRVGDLMLRQGNVSEAVDYYEKAADLYSDGGFFNNAIALCNKILRNAPGRSSVYYKLGKISAKKGFVNDAKANFLEYADRMQKSDQLEEAFRALKEFADLCPDQDDIRLMLADQLVRKDRQGEAVEQLTMLYEKFQGEGRTREAQATVDRIRAIDPQASIPEVTTGSAAAQKPRDLVFLEVSYDGPGANPDDYRHPSRGKVPSPPPSVPSPPGLVVFDPDDLDADDDEFRPGTRRTTEPQMIPPLALEPMIPDLERPSGEEDTDDLLESEPSAVLPFLEVESDPGGPRLEGVMTFAAETAEEEPVESPAMLPGLESNAVAGEADAEDLDLVGDDWLAESPSLSELDDELDIGAELQLLELEPDGAESPSLPTLVFSEPEIEDSLVTGTGTMATDPLLDTDDLIDLDGLEIEPATPAATSGDDALPSASSLYLLSDQMPGADVEQPGGASDPFSGDLDAQSVNWLDPLPSVAAREFTTVSSPLDADLDFDGAELPDLAGDLELIDLEDGSGELSASGSTELTGDASWEPFAPEMSDRRLPAIPDEGSEEDVVESIASAAPAPLTPVEGLRRDIEHDAQNWDLHKELAEALLEEGERAAGLHELERAMDGFERTGDTDAARSVVDELLRIDPNSIRYHQKRVELAVRSNEPALLVDAYLALADCFFRAGQVDKSRAVAARVLDLAPQDARAQAALASFGIAERPTPPSTAAPPTPIRGQGPTPTPRSAPTPARPSAPPSIAARSPTPPPARSGPGTPPVPPPPSSPTSEDEYVNLGEWLREQDVPKSTRMTADVAEPTDSKQVEFDEMLTMFKQGVAANLDDADTESHYDLGVAYKEMGLLDEAIAEFQKALRGAERRVRTYEALGQCFVEKKQFQIAITILTRALNDRSATDDVLIGVLYLLGAASETLQHWTDALGFYRRVLGVDVNFRDTRARLAAVERKLG